MKIKLKNLGALQQAAFELGDFTLICGKNNTGKTYATYALYGFLDTWREMMKVAIEQAHIDALLKDGVVHIELNFYLQQAETLLQAACANYSKKLPEIFSANAGHLQEATFHLELPQPITPLASFERRLRSANTELFSLEKKDGENSLVVSLLVATAIDSLPASVIRDVVGSAISEILFAGYFPKPFIASAERTGAAIFRKELNFARNRLLEEINQAGKDINPLSLLLNSYQDYALPVERNVDFTRQLESVTKKNSFLLEQHGEVLSDFADIIGGEYNLTRNDELYFMPHGKRIKLTMDESSSTVRSLLSIGFYLRHVASVGDLLIVDEPELNLHPENQRRIARLFARLVNLGVKVFLTTHSDYIVKELNTLMMLNHDKPYLKDIAQQEGYKQHELLSAKQVKVYIAKDELIKLDGNKKRTRCQTLVAAKVDPQWGIDAPSFDETIETMNRIQEAIVWGGDA